MSQTDLVVVGGGIAGLVVAAEAARAGARVTVLEQQAHTGGLLAPLHIAGITIDGGAESFATRTDAVERLIADLGLELDVVSPNPVGAMLAYTSSATAEVNRAPLPRRTVLGIPADPAAADVVRVIGAAGSERALAEPPFFGEEPDLNTLVREQLGAEVAERLVDPICRSVYSRPASQLHLSAVHPQAWAVFQQTRSLTAMSQTIAPTTSAGSAVAGIRGGMWRLADAVAHDARNHGAEIRTGVVVERLKLSPRGVVVEVAGHAPLTAQHVVVASNAADAAQLLEPFGAVPSSETGSDVRLVVAAVRSPDLAARPVGNGLIITESVNTRAKALTHVDAKWAWIAERLAADAALVRLSLREGSDEYFDEAELVAELELLTGARIQAVKEVTHLNWPDAASAGRQPLDATALNRAEEAGITVTGAHVAGTGLASVIPHARAVAARVISNLSATVRSTL